MNACDQCAEPAVVFLPGIEPVHELFLLARGEPQRCLCLEHAKLAGWPWCTSEVVKRPRASAER